MRHRVSGRGLGRTSGERRSLFRNQLVSLLMHERIRTTEAKARELQAMADKVIALGRADTEQNRSRAASLLANSPLARKPLEHIRPRYPDRTAAYSPHSHHSHRQSDVHRALG